MSGVRTVYEQKYGQFWLNICFIDCFFYEIWVIAENFWFNMSKITFIGRIYEQKYGIWP